MKKQIHGKVTSYAALISLNFSSAPGLLFKSGWYCSTTGVYSLGFIEIIQWKKTLQTWLKNQGKCIHILMSEKKNECVHNLSVL